MAIIDLQTFKELIDASELIRIEELPNTNFFGFALDRNVTDADERWNIYRASLSGFEIELITASGEFNQVWDNRAALFGAPPFSNVKSVLCDGVNDHILIGNVSLLDFDGTTDAFSISAWFRTNVTAERIIFSKQGGGNNVGYRLTTQVDQLRIHISGGAAGNRIEVRTPTLTTADDDWHHVVMTYTGSSAASGVNMIVDGVDQSGSLTISADTLTTWGTNSIAAQMSGRNGTTLEWDGFLDEIAVFDVGLSVASAQAIFNSGNPADMNQDLGSYVEKANMVSYYRFDNDVFPNILDRSNVGNGLDGVMTNMTESDLVSEVP